MLRRCGVGQHGPADFFFFLIGCFMPIFSRGTMRAACLGVAAIIGLNACAPLVVGGAVVATAVAVDRRTAGTQLEDQAIALKTLSTLRDALGDGAHVNVDSFNRQVLLTGEVPTEQAREHASQLAHGVENVRTVFNELQVMPASTLTQRSQDTWITSKVRSLILADGELPAKSIKVTTERSVVYLQGLVTQQEGGQTVDIARNVQGVEKVVSLFEYVSPEEVRALQAEHEARNAQANEPVFEGPQNE